MRNRYLISGLLILLVGSPTFAQTGAQANPARARVVELLRANGVTAASASPTGDEPKTSLELQIGFGLARELGSDSHSAIQGDGLYILDSKLTEAPPPKSRSFSLTGHSLLVVGLSADGIATSLAVIRDPRVGISESVDGEGRMSGSEVVQTQYPVAIVALRADREIAELRVFEPQWSGDTLVALRPVGSIGLARRNTSEVPK